MSIAAFVLASVLATTGAPPQLANEPPLSDLDVLLRLLELTERRIERVETEISTLRGQRLEIVKLLATFTLSPDREAALEKEIAQLSAASSRLESFRLDSLRTEARSLRNRITATMSRPADAVPQEPASASPEVIRLRAELAELRTRMTDDHPEVVRARARLQAAVAAER